MLGQLIFDRLEDAARHSQPGPGVTRLFLSDEHRAVTPLIRDWMTKSGLTSEIDAAGNIVGRDAKALSGAPTLILGSHQDTVVSGGKYDGMLGVALPIKKAHDFNPPLSGHAPLPGRSIPRHSMPPMIRASLSPTRLRLLAAIPMTSPPLSGTARMHWALSKSISNRGRFLKKWTCRLVWSRP